MMSFQDDRARSLESLRSMVDKKIEAIDDREAFVTMINTLVDEIASTVVSPEEINLIEEAIRETDELPDEVS